jgi:hypothetical protein
MEIRHPTQTSGQPIPDIKLVKALKNTPLKQLRTLGLLRSTFGLINIDKLTRYGSFLFAVSRNLFQWTPQITLSLGGQLRGFAHLELPNNALLALLLSRVESA